MSLLEATVRTPWPFWRPVVRKTITPEFLARHPEARKAFQDTAGLVGVVAHPNLLALLAVRPDGPTPGVDYGYAVRLLGSGSLPLSVEAALSVGGQIAAALRAIHAARLRHDNLRPASLYRGWHGQVLLGDFGLGQVLAPKDDADLAAFASPERIRNDPALDGRSDLYSLGMVLFYLLTGRLPFDVVEVEKRCLWHVSPGVAPPASSFRPDVPSAVEGVLAKLLAKPVQARFQSAADLLRALRRAAQLLNLKMPLDAEAGDGVGWQPAPGPSGTFWACVDGDAFPAGLQSGEKCATVQLGLTAPVLELRRTPDPVVAVYQQLAGLNRDRPYVAESTEALDRLLTNLIQTVTVLHEAGMRLHLGCDGVSDAGRLATLVLRTPENQPLLYAAVERWTVFGHGKIDYQTLVLPNTWKNGWRTTRLLLGAGGWKQPLLTRLLQARTMKDAAALDDWRGVVQFAYFQRTALTEGVGWEFQRAEAHAKRVLPQVLPGARGWLRRTFFPAYSDVLNWGLGFNAGYLTWVRRAASWASRCRQSARVLG
jgi:Protein kinase domain